MNDLEEIHFEKFPDGLVPAVIQDADTRNVLMLGYMSAESLRETKARGKVVFFSRTRQSLWLKGETSGNYLNVVEIKSDCDNDAILVRARPDGPVCHTGSATCFEDANDPCDFLFELEGVIAERLNNPSENSYTSKLFSKGLNKIVQKFGEEAVELVIESKDDDPDLFCGEAADMLYHFLVLLRAKGVDLADVLATLESRHRSDIS